ncbi:MAG: hypothetical protein QM731_02710 [Chitinophagaceae bacterium]
MKQFFITLPLFLAPLFMSAQYLAHNDVPASREFATPVQPGNYWKPEASRVTGKPAKKQLAAIQKVAQEMLDFCKDSVFDEAISSPSVVAEYYVEKNSTAPFKFRITCDWKPGGTLTFTANDMSSLTERFYLNNQEYLVIPAPKAPRRECPYFETSDANNSNAYNKIWMVTVDNVQLPYTLLTRRDYLQGAKAELTAIISKITATVQHNMPVRTAEMQDADKKKAIEQLQRMYSGAALQVRIRNLEERYRSDEDTQKDGIDRETARYRKTMALVDSLLQGSAEELKRPVSTIVEPVSFTGFDENDNSSLLIKMNTDYLNPAIPAEKIQFLLVTWTANEQSAETAAIEKQLGEKLHQPLLRKFLLK